MWFDLIPEKDALFLDIDGTLIDIAPTPDGVVMPEQLKEDLSRLHTRLGGALALVSGRAITFIDTLFHPLRLPAAGVHGAEWRRDGESTIEFSPLLPDTMRVLLNNAFHDHPGVRLEDKGSAFAVHFRLAPDMEAAIEVTMRELVEQSEGRFKLQKGKMLLEIVSSSLDKGDAVRRFLNAPPFKNRRPIFIGDDLTDLPAMAVCQKLGGVTAQVGENRPFPNPATVRLWLNQQANEQVLQR